jgi:hypothetical protein
MQRFSIFSFVLNYLGCIQNVVKTSCLGAITRQNRSYHGSPLKLIWAGHTLIQRHSPHLLICKRRDRPTNPNPNPPIPPPPPPPLPFPASDPEALTLSLLLQPSSGRRTTTCSGARPGEGWPQRRAHGAGAAGGLGDRGRSPGDAAGGRGGPRAALLPLGLRVPPLPLGHQLLLLLARTPLLQSLLAHRLRHHPPL